MQNGSPRLERNNIADIYPLAPMQEGILFHSMCSPGDGLYMPQTALRIIGPVDAGALKIAWQNAIDRHTVLRSGFFWEQRDEPFQIAFRSIPVAFTTLDWTGADASTERDRLSALFSANKAEPFDLRRPPLIRIQWIRTGEEQSIMVVCYHHIVLDGWSIRQLLDEVLSLYRSVTSRTGVALLPARPYGDYIGWLKTREREASIRFWHDRLEGFTKPTQLLAGEQTSRFERQRWELPQLLHQSVQTYCATSGLTLNTLLQGALALLIARQLDRRDIIFGTTTAGRPATLDGATTMIGLFINTLPVRVSISDGQSVHHWLSSLQSAHAETSEHDYVPLATIQGSGTSLFDTLLVVENFATQMKQRDETSLLKTEGIDFDERTHFPLTLWATPHSAGLTLMAGFSQDVLSPETAMILLERIGEIISLMIRSSSIDMHALLKALPAPIASDQLSGFEAKQRGEALETAVVTTPRYEAHSETQETLMRIWADVLKRGPLDGSANFFELGGHSLLAARVVSRLRTELGVPLPVRALFEHPVLAELAAHIDGMRVRETQAPGHVEIEI